MRPAVARALVFAFSSASLGFLGCGKSNPSGQNSAQKNPPAFALQWGVLSLMEVDAEKGLLPSSPRLLDVQYVPERTANVVPSVQIIQQGKVIEAWGTSSGINSAESALPEGSGDYTTGGYSPDFALCKIGPVLEPLLVTLQALAVPANDSFPKPVSLPDAVAALSSCELKSALTCFAQKVNILFKQGLDSANPVQKGKALTAIANTFKDCAHLSEFNPQTGFTFFRVSGNDVAFSPSPLFAVAIYEGVQSDYDHALVALDPVATIAADSACGSLSKGCLVSPLPISRCPKCTALKTGTPYTAFLLEEARQRHQDIRHVVFQVGWAAQ